MSEVAMPALPSFVLPLLRSLLGIVAGWVIAKGWFTAEQWAQIVGGLGALVAFLWTAYSRSKTREALKDAIAAPAGQAKP